MRSARYQRLGEADPTEGLTYAERTALCDATNGLLGLIDGQFQRQTLRPNFTHSPALVARLVARGLLEMLADDVAQSTLRGRRCAARLRGRRETIRIWENAKPMRRAECRGTITCTM